MDYDAAAKLILGRQAAPCPKELLHNRNRRAVYFCRIVSRPRTNIGWGIGLMLKAKYESFDTVAAERITVAVFAVGAVMLIVGVLIEYYRLAH
jgi:hypothetical protein